MGCIPAGGRSWPWPPVRVLFGTTQQFPIMPSLVRARAPSLRRDRAMLIYTQRELNWGLFFNKTINSKYGEKQSRPGWAPDPPMVGIRSPIGLVVGSCTSHPGVLGSIPKREEPGSPGKTGAPCVKVPGSSRPGSQGKQAHPVLKYRVPVSPFEVRAHVSQRLLQLPGRHPITITITICSFVVT
jgi:hypothetical protein